MTYIFVVSCEEGSYSNYTKETVCAFYDQKAAQKYCDEYNDFARDCINFSEKSFELKNPQIEADFFKNEILKPKYPTFWHLFSGYMSPYSGSQYIYEEIEIK